MRLKQFFFILFIIFFIETCLSAIILPVCLRLLSHHDFSINPELPTFINNPILASSIFFILAPFYLIAAPFLGNISDKFGRKKAMLICLSISFFGYSFLCLSALSNSILAALFGIFLLNTNASMVIIQAIVIDASQGKQRAFNFGIITFILLPVYLLMFHLSDTLFNLPSINHILIMRILLFGAIIFTAFNIFLVFKLLPLPSNNKEKISLNLANDFYSIFNKKGIGKIFSLTALLQFGCGLYFGSLEKFSTISLTYNAHDLDILRYTNITILTVGLLLVYPALVKFFDVKKILLYAIICCFIGALGDSLIPSEMSHWIFSIVLSLGDAISIAALWSLLSSLAPQTHRGLVMGLNSAIWSLSWAMSVIAGHMMSHHLSFILPLWITVMFFFLSLLLIPLDFEPHKAE